MLKNVEGPGLKVFPVVSKVKLAERGETQFERDKNKMPKISTFGKSVKTLSQVMMKRCF